MTRSTLGRFRRLNVLLPRVACVVLTCLAGIGLLASCSNEETARSDNSADPPVAEAPASTRPVWPTVAELREQLGAGPDAVFRKAGGEIRFISLGGSSQLKDITPLKGLPLRMLDLRETQVADITVLKGMPLEELYLESTNVTDISPLAGMPLEKLYLNHTKVSDLTPLAGMQFDELNLFGTPVTDISPLKNAEVNTLWLRETGVTSIAPLAGHSLVSLDIEQTPVADLSSLAGMTSLQRLNIAGTAVTDLTPLAGLPLTRLILTPSRITTGLEVVRRMQTLTELDVTFREPSRLSPREFWQQYDAGTLAEPPVPAEAPQEP
ncbi:MAG: hypothetical protein KDA79_04220 [Planctomycetaceae bacterium]|nr:hypothetical protein [Planctomycetaceae bacterium]